MPSAEFLVCFNFHNALMFLKVGENIVYASNSLDLGETASHPDQSCLHYGTSVVLGGAKSKPFTCHESALVRFSFRTFA